MNAAGAEREMDFTVEDVEYLRHGDKPLLARLFRPKGKGPFPAVVELHGGAWSQFDRTRGKSVHEALAKSGFVVASLDFRQGAEGAYPLSVADIHYGLRWLKANAQTFDIAPDRVGISGNSSGGHLAMLVAMRPEDPGYAAIPLPAGAPQVDAAVRCIVMLWPVINPLGRYRHVLRLKAQGNAPEWVERVIDAHHAYWKTEEAMSIGSPMLALERGEKLAMPPALWIQSTQDDVHNYRDEDSDFPGGEAERFAANYRKAGGAIELEYFDAPPLFTTVHPTLPESIASLQTIVAFFRKHLG
ncbi:MAG: alpha/beta hydrolase [Rhodospirillaceae bacterium]|nr:alpha/beta hydrolase [Rhodospirillaceae bacterium]